ncbi:MAG: hypothetical protein ABI741_01500 [Ferruginibacter sp.]
MPTLKFACTCAAALFLLVSCNNKKTKAGNEQQQSPSSSTVMANPQEETINIPDFQKGYEQLLTQRFTAAAGKITVIKADKGLKLTVDPLALEKENGEAVNDAINVSIIELTNSEDLFKSNAATVSDGKLLMSGGSYYIGMESEGEKLHIRKGYFLEVEFPKLRKEDMELFYGQRDSGNNMNWKPAGESLEPPEEPIEFTYATYRYDTVYRVDTIREPDKSVYSYSFLTGRVFRDLNAKVFYYDQQVTLGQLLDTVNKHSRKLCLDSISFWPPNLPKNRTLDTNYLVTVYGPRFQLMLKKCECKDDEAKKYPYIRRDTSINSRVVSSLADQVQKYYAPEQINALGWINCDRYDNRPMSDMEFEIPITFNTNPNIQYFVLFKSFSGCINGSIIPNAQKFVINQLPLNEEITLIAFTKSKGLIYQARTDLRVSQKKNMILDFKEISMAEMNKIFGRNVRI